MTDFGGVGQGAYCALHPDQQASRTCARCGNFMCTFCSQGGEQPTCPTCLERTGVAQSFPLTRDTWTFSALWDYCFETFKTHWLMILVGVLIIIVISGISGAVAQVLTLVGAASGNDVVAGFFAVVGGIVNFVVQGVMGIGLARMMIDVLQGQPPNIERLFSQFHKAWTYFLTMLIVILASIPVIGAVVAVVVGLMALFRDQEAIIAIVIVMFLVMIVPILYFTLALSLLPAEMAARDTLPSPLQLLRNCFAYARGERLSMFGVAMIQVLLMLAGVIACCIGIIPAMGISSLLSTGLYLALSSGADVER